MRFLLLKLLLLRPLERTEQAERALKPLRALHGERDMAETHNHTAADRGEPRCMSSCPEALARDFYPLLCLGWALESKMLLA